MEIVKKRPNLPVYFSINIISISHILSTKSISKAIRKEFVKKIFEDCFRSQELEKNDIFLLFKGFFSFNEYKRFLIEGFFHFELINLPYCQSLLEFETNGYKPKVDSKIKFEYQPLYQSYVGEKKSKKELNQNSLFFGKGDFLKIKIFFPIIKLSDRCLIQEISFEDKFLKSEEKESISENQFTVKNFKKEFYQNGQLISRFFISRQTEKDIFGFFSQNSFFLKFNFGPEFRFQERKTKIFSD